MITVTGASGNIGRPLVEALALAGEKVTAVSRNPLPHDLPEGARHVRADLADPATLGPALDGADALFLLPAGELLGGGPPAAEVLSAAGEAGVRRVVLLSSQINGTRPDAPSHGRLREFEQAVRSSGLAWTILRPGGFASNAYAWSETVRTRRTVFAPFADVALPVVDPADIAEVAALVLRDEGHAGQTYELTGPVAVTPRRQAAALAEALGEQVDFVELTRAQAREHMARFMPEPVIDGTLDVLGEPLPAEQRVSPDVEKLLGRPAGPFAGWARRHAHAFA
ncbi:SDR family oxidoreductase [Streptomyces caeruleatus]|uniref:NmrA family transcriptional regulator n=1 Tax=Streptomyces caeruleatus TaxID=661399 RepID=A0A101TYN9_9ACTN|nr:NAD(P)H-binding protein [Streptomyces caeruleatus]KUO01090.1 NmrA family transcriptional regulator [Streptomyces caeruleatus]